MQDLGPHDVRHQDLCKVTQQIEATKLIKMNQGTGVSNDDREDRFHPQLLPPVESPFNVFVNMTFQYIDTMGVEKTAERFQ
jgi:hypothetical protein